MSTRSLLNEILGTIQAETEAVIHGDAKAIMAGVARHEELLSQLEGAEMDMSPAELKELVGQIDREKVKLQSLLQSQSAQTDLLLRAMFGGGAARSVGYPNSGWQQQEKARRLNRRT